MPMCYATRYELQAIAPDGRKYLAGYVRIPSLSSAVKMLRQNGTDWVKVTGSSEFIPSGKGRSGWRLNLGSWVVCYSGRTKLESIRSPLPFFTTSISER